MKALTQTAESMASIVSQLMQAFPPTSL